MSKTVLFTELAWTTGGNFNLRNLIVNRFLISMTHPVQVNILEMGSLGNIVFRHIIMEKIEAIPILFDITLVYFLPTSSYTRYL